MNVDAKLLVTDEQKNDVLKAIDERLKELELKYEVTEKDVTMKELTITLKLSRYKSIKHLFNIVKAPESELKYLCKVNSIIVATAKDVLSSIINSIRM